MTQPHGGRYLCVSLLQASGPQTGGSATLGKKGGGSLLFCPPALTPSASRLVPRRSKSSTSSFSPSTPAGRRGPGSVLPGRGPSAASKCVSESLAGVGPSGSVRPQVDIYQVPPSADMLSSPLQPFLVCCQALPEAMGGAPMVPRPVKCHFKAAADSKAVNAEQARATGGDRRAPPAALCR